MKKLILIFSILAISIFGFSQKVVNNGSKIVANGGKIVVTGYSPRLLDNKILWLDSEDLTTIVKDVSNYVEQWNDKSGLSNNITAPLATNEPLFSTDGIIFDGTNDIMSCVFSSTYSQPVTVYIVIKQRSTEIVSYYLDATTQTGNWYVFRRTTGDNLNLYAGVSVNTYVKAGIFDKTLFKIEYNGSSTEIFENGVSKGVVNTGTNTINSIVVGAEQTGAFYSDVNYYEILYVEGILTTEVDAELNSYFKKKYNL